MQLKKKKTQEYRKIYKGSRNLISAFLGPGNHYLIK